RRHELDLPHGDRPDPRDQPGLRRRRQLGRALRERPDTTAGFSWAFDTGFCFGVFGSNGFVTSFAACGTYSVATDAQDKDYDVSAPFTSSSVVHVFGEAFRPPIDPGSLNLVQHGQVVPVRITIGCSEFLSGLH